MSLWKISFFKRHFLEYWGGYGALPSKKDVGWIQDRGRWGWLGGAITGGGKDANWWDSASSYGRPAYYPRFIDKDEGQGFVDEAIKAQYAYFQGDTEEFFILSRIASSSRQHVLSPH